MHQNRVYLKANKVPMDHSNHSIEKLRYEARTKSISGLLDQIESRLGKMGTASANLGLPVLIEMDEVYHRLKNYNGPEDSLRAERTQFDYVQTIIRSNMSLLLKQAGGGASLRALRNQVKPGTDQWWWYLDDLSAEQRRDLLKRFGIISGAALVVIALLVVIYQAFLAPDPETIARLQYQRQAEIALMAGDIDTALLEIEQALQYAPQNLDLLMMRAIGQQLTGQDDTSQASFIDLEQRFETREAFLLQRAMFYNQFGRHDLALENAEEVINANPNSALGQYYAGIASENLQLYTEALAYYEIAFELASEQDQSTLAATIRMNMGMLMQALPGLISQELGEAE
jgi:tetratricopeptide (TPR) repeat protein